MDLDAREAAGASRVLYHNAEQFSYIPDGCGSFHGQSFKAHTDSELLRDTAHLLWWRYGANVPIPVQQPRKAKRIKASLQQSSLCKTIMVHLSLTRFLSGRVSRRLLPYAKYVLLSTSMYS